MVWELSFICGIFARADHPLSDSERLCLFSEAPRIYHGVEGCGGQSTVTEVQPQREDPLRLLFDTAVDAIIVMKADGTVADWNDRATEIFGWSREEAIGQSLAELVIPVDTVRPIFAGFNFS